MEDFILERQMGAMRWHDSSPEYQTSMARLEIVGTDRVVTSLDAALNAIKNTVPRIGIFFTGGHTMGYRYFSGEEEFFDMEQGLFRAGSRKVIKDKIEEKYAGLVIGCRIVRLPT